MCLSDSVSSQVLTSFPRSSGSWWWWAWEKRGFHSKSRLFSWSFSSTASTVTSVLCVVESYQCDHLKNDGTETVHVTPVRRMLASSPWSERARCRRHGHAGGKTLLQQNPLILNWGCRLMQVVLYNDCKLVAVVVVTIWRAIVIVLNIAV